MLTLLLAATTASADPVAALDLLLSHHDGLALASAPRLERSVYEQALAGGAPTGLLDVEGHRSRVAWGVAVVDTPLHRYWAAINDDQSKVEHTRLEHLAILAGQNCGRERRVFQYVDVPMLTDRWWVVDLVQNDALSTATRGVLRELSWKSRPAPADELPSAVRTWADQGMQVTFTEGAWVLADLGDARTLVLYYTWSDPGGNIPARVASSFAEGGIADTIAAMERLAKAGPRCLE
jgi:hypothetical protein